MGTESMCRMRGCNDESAGGKRWEVSRPETLAFEYPLCAAHYDDVQAAPQRYGWTLEPDEVYLR